jgi:uncharacterized protein YegP (UPF0339 family)
MRVGNSLLVHGVVLTGFIVHASVTWSAAAASGQAAAKQEAKKAGRALKFETYTDAKGEYRWRLRATNGQVIATSGQGYKDKRDRLNAIERIKKDAKTLKFQQYPDTGGQLRWRLIASNGQIIATSGQGYKDKRDCENAIEVIKNGSEGARVEEAKEE